MVDTMQNINLNSQDGVGLLEVLVSLVLLAIAILGFVAFITRAVALTAESDIRVNALNVMRDLGDSMRHNVSGKDTYKSKLNAYTDALNNGNTVGTPAATCGSFKVTSVNDSNSCNQENQADAAAYKAARTAFDNGFKLKMDSCPGTNGRLQCLIAAWNDTNATIGSAADDCMVESTGLYKDGSECLVIEVL